MPVPRRPLVVTADPGLLDDLLRLAAAGGAEVDVAHDPAAARPRYSAAPLVVIGADQVQPCVRARLPRRCRVIIVGPGSPPDEVWAGAQLLGADHVAALPVAEPWVVDQFAAPPTDRSGARVLAVIGGRGGAGASILATALAVTAVRGGRRTLLIDADPLGGGLDLVLGWEKMVGLRWPELAAADGRVDPAALMGALPRDGDLVLLSFTRQDALAPVPGEAMAATLDAARRGRDLVVVDLPRRLDDAATLALQAADRTLLVVPAELRATAAAGRIAAMVAHHCDHQAVVVRGPAPGRLKPKDVAAALSLPLAGVLEPEPGMCQALERGEPPAAAGRGPLAELCRDLLAAAA
ncbi:septum site-determining protein Ssd [Actinoplanes sp. NPDC051470]|uniref:septum site-determining protein Ssd n=1 Tax=Actinoplanes sp. NPDC051470 TaxID=3157224 RepID=UPI003439B264